MAAPLPPSWFERYQRVRRRAEWAYWVVVLGIQCMFNTVVLLLDLGRTRLVLPVWEPVLWEASSHLGLGLLIPLVVAWERRWPLHWRTVRAHLPWHFLASLWFCLLHVAIMVLLRHLGYAAMGRDYSFSPWPTALAYEYLKDVRSYALILAALVSYRLLLLRWQGEARVLDEPEPAPDAPMPASVLPPASLAAPATPTPTRPERFLVRQLRREFLIAAADIEWLQAQGNYVALHVNGRDYLLRATLTDFLLQLDPARFVRVHRSHGVNLDRIAEIEPLDGGDARLHMRDGSTVPCSRRYRAVLSGAVEPPSETAAAPQG